METAMRLSREDLKKITHRVRPRNQAAWFEEYLGVAVPWDSDGPILTPSTYEALVAKRLGVGPTPAEASPERRPVVHLPPPRKKPVED
jgi:hypothetical protein